MVGSTGVRKRSAGILVFQRDDDGMKVLLGHMGGPWWKNRDRRAWTIPKGEYLPGETGIEAASREFLEELGVPVPVGDLRDLGEVRQAGGKVVIAWAVEGDVDLAAVEFGTFEMEWPKGSGRLVRFPELDKVDWFDIQTAETKVVAAQRQFLWRLRDLLTDRDRSDGR